MFRSDTIRNCLPYRGRYVWPFKIIPIRENVQICPTLDQHIRIPWAVAFKTYFCHGTEQVRVGTYAIL